MPVILGVDPGKTGAIALFGDRLITVADMPIAGGAVDPALLADAFEGLLAGRERPDMVVIEKQQSMPLQSSSSTFVAGTNYGMILGVCGTLDWPIELIRPGDWKRRTATPKDKDAARARASQLMPEGARFWPLKKHDGRAEAALLAWYGANIVTSRQQPELALARA